MLVPHADFNCLKLPGTPGDSWEDDFLLLADVFPTGYHATELACVSPGKTVAIFGAGPSKIVSHHIDIDEALDAYDKFDKRSQGYTKILIQFGDRAKAA